jgi:hypothetical protein
LLAARAGNLARCIFYADWRSLDPDLDLCIGCIRRAGKRIESGGDWGRLGSSSSLRCGLGGGLTLWESRREEAVERKDEPTTQCGFEEHRNWIWTVETGFEKRKRNQVSEGILKADVTETRECLLLMILLNSCRFLDPFDSLYTKRD